MDARADDIAALTFAMLIIDYNLPPETEDGQPLSFRNRDLVTVDEGHGLENQAASLFAGFAVSPWSVPPEVFGNAGARADWNDDRYEDVERILREVNTRARNFIRQYEDLEEKESQVEKCENFLRKLEYCQEEIKNDRPWVVNVDEIVDRDGDETKSIQLKPVYVDDFLSRFVWGRGKRRIISSATIPYRDNIGKWTDRIGVDGKTELISKPMPFDKEHRPIYLNTIAGSMSSSDEEDTWPDAMDQVREIHSHHRGENGLVHTNSYDRAERFQQSLGSDKVMVQDQDKDQDAVIRDWQESDKDILASPAMTEGVDLHGDKCRWQVLLKCPFPYLGDSRVSYLVEENKDWNWYMQSTAIAIQQSVGRAVRGPEPSEAAVFYVVDEKFGDVMFNRTNPPEWFTEAIVNDTPEFWDNPQAAPWR